MCRSHLCRCSLQRSRTCRTHSCTPSKCVPSRSDIGPCSRRTGPLKWYRSGGGMVWVTGPLGHRCSRTRRTHSCTPYSSGASWTCTSQCNADTGRSSWAGRYRFRYLRWSPSRMQICTGCRTHNRTACPRTCTPSGSSHRFGRRGAWAGCSRRCSFHYRPRDTRAGWAPRVQGVCSWKDYTGPPTSY